MTDDLCMVHERDLVNLQAERDRYRVALELIAYHEPQEGERAEAMRRIAREALWV